MEPQRRECVNSTPSGGLKVTLKPFCKRFEEAFENLKANLKQVEEAFEDLKQNLNGF